MPAVNVGQFAAALTRVWRPRGRAANGAHTIGLAVSGGSDSMALAYLCSQLQNLKNEHDPGLVKRAQLQELRFRAFVVDHKARDGSTEEAQKVCSYLDNTGIHSEILTLDWKSKVNGQPPPSCSNFESQARRLRYQALGHACPRYGIDSVLLGHHQDDQVETVLERLVGGYTGLGLLGIRSSARIPECHGIAGVSEFLDDSNKLDALAESQTSSRSVEDPPGRMISRKPQERFDEPKRSAHNVSIRPATMGITIHRPLLEFTKVDLIETCRANNITWVNDHTNQDRTATLRNTIRYMLQKEKLPLALRGSRVLGLRKRTWQTGELTHRSLKRVIDLYHILSFDTRTGQLICSLPRNCDPPGDVNKALRPETFAAAFRAFAQPVSPLAVVGPDAGRSIYDNLSYFRKGNTSFDVAETSWTRLTSRHRSNTWIIARSPPRRGPGQTPTSEWPQAATPTSAASRGWQLWDGRFWIRVTCKDDTVVLCRPFEPDDIGSKLRNVLDDAQFEELKKHLHQVARGKARFSLPVLVNKTSGAVLALPSIGFRAPESEVLIDYDVRYKALTHDVLA